MPCLLRFLAFCCLMDAACVSLAVAADPLHQQIDAAISAKSAGPSPLPAAERSSDAEFLRRVTLDLTGTIPTGAETRQFLADTAADKRVQLIDRLLASPGYARRMQQFFTVMWLERRVGKEIADDKWEAYLRESFAANKPWDQLTRELVAADSGNPQTVAALKFYLDRLPGGVELQVRDVGRLFLGRDLQCAQCHDHPLVHDYEQVHFHGMAAFLNRSFLAKDPQNQQPIMAEKAEGAKVSFESVFVRGPKETGPRLLNGPEVAIPAFEKGQEFAEPAANGKPGVPKFRPRQILAEQLANAGNEAFVTNSVNRLWFLMLGRGLVHPLDLHHSANPASHPELLKTLAAEFTASKFDVRNFLREIALSETYQRSSELPANVSEPPAPETFLIANFKGLSAEQMTWALLTATGELDGVQAGAATAPGKLEDFYKKFRGVYANPPGEPEVEFTPSLAAALFLANDGLILNCLRPREGNLIDRLAKSPDAAAVADELYLSVLSRLPSDEERAEVAAYLTQRGAQRAEALGELAWSLVASTEFCVNH